MKKKSFLNRKWVPEWLKPYIYNRYMLTLIAALIWMTFFDKHDFLIEYSYRQKLHSFEKERDYYVQEIKKNRELTVELFTNMKNLERFAREKYYMKRDNEDVFVFVRENSKGKEAEKNN